MNKTWSSTIFRINKFKGVINKKFDAEYFKFKKIKESDIINILHKIEKGTKNFKFLRIYTKFKYFIFIIFFILGFFALFSFSYFKNISLGLSFVYSIIILLLGFILISHFVYKKCIKSPMRVVHEIITNVNENIFLRKGMYMLACTKLNFIAIYVIPDSVTLGLIMNKINNVSENSQINENPSDLSEVINIKNRQNIFDKKYTNFRNNYITDFRM